MRLASLAVIVLTALAPASAAADGIYITESFGGTDVKDELSAHMGSAFRVRIAGGFRRKNLAFELWMGLGLSTGAVPYESAPEPNPPGYEITTPDGGYQGGGYDDGGYHGGSGSTDLVTYGVDVKYLQPLSRHLEGYVRGGLSRGIAYGLGAEGRGMGIGAGVQLKGKVPALGFLFWPLFFTGWGPKITAAVFADTSYEFYRLHGATRTTDAQLSHLTFGFAVGSDF